MVRRETKAIILAALLLFLGVSCRRPPVTILTEVRDSVTVKEVVRLDTVTLPGDTVRLTGVVIECDSATNRAKPLNLARRGAAARLRVTISPAGTLTASGGCDSLKRVVGIRDKEITRLTARLNTVIKPPEYRTRGIDYFCRCFTAVVIAVLLVVTGLKLKGWI